jgi:hypothetical protein
VVKKKKRVSDEGAKEKVQKKAEGERLVFEVGSTSKAAEQAGRAPPPGLDSNVVGRPRWLEKQDPL